MADHNQSQDFSQTSRNPYQPNTAAIPNILFDYWMAKLTPGEFKVLMAIARKTYGYHKRDGDRISLSQISEITGLSKKGVVEIISSLVEHQLVIKIKSKTESGDDAPNFYEINDHSEGEVVNSGNQGGSELSSLGVVNSGNTQNPIYKTHVVVPRAHPRVGCGNVHNSSIPKTVTKMTTPGVAIECSQNDYFLRCIKLNLSFTTDEILMAWEVFVQSTAILGPGTSWMKFIDQIIINKKKEAERCNSPTNKEKKEMKNSRKKYEDERQMPLADASPKLPSQVQKRGPVTREFLEKSGLI